MKSPAITYPTRKRNSRTEYEYGGKWRTASGWARECDADYKTMATRLHCGYPPHIPVHFIWTVTEDGGEWMPTECAAQIAGMSNWWVLEHRKKVDGVWVLDITEKARERRAAEASEKRQRAANYYRARKHPKDQDIAVVHKSRGDKVANQFATLRF